MKTRLTLLLCCLLFSGCARMTNMMTLNGVSEIPQLSEPDIVDE